MLEIEEALGAQRARNAISTLQRSLIYYKGNTAEEIRDGFELLEFITTSGNN